METKHFRKTAFYIESSDNYVGYTKGELWNGWECPRFKKEIATQIMKDFSNDDYPSWYDENLDAFIYKYSEVDIDFYNNNLTKDELNEYYHVYEGFDSEGLHLYAIGAWFWIWDEYEMDKEDE